MPNTEDTGVPLQPDGAWDTPWQTIAALFTGEFAVPALIAVGRHIVHGAIAMFKRSTDERCRNTVLLVGLGRSGKTQLIQTLVGKNNSPPQRTIDFTITPKEEILHGTIYHFNFIDYKGQDFGQLIRHLRTEYPQIGEINSLIMMVDLFPCVKDEDHNARFDQYSKDRIREHLKQWNTMALDAVMGLLTRGFVRYVCLFINKIDKLEGALVGDDFCVIKKEYQSLIDDLEHRVGDIADFEAVVGSAQIGHGVFGPHGIRSKLMLHCRREGLRP
jgi:hypothetical protein